MNTKRFWLACLAVYVVYHILGILVHQVWLDPTYQELAHIWRPQADMESKMWIFFVTSAVWTVIFCYVFVRGCENKGIMEGVRYGALIGVFFSTVQAFDSYVIYPIPFSLALKWFISGVIIVTILGVVAAAVYKPEETAQS